MNKSQDYKTVIETGALPKIISDKKVFAEMTIPEKKAFYKQLDKTLTEFGYQRHQDTYKQMCLYPETKINQAFLINRKKDTVKWHVYVNAISYCLYAHLLRSLENWQQEHKALVTDMQRADKRIREMQTDIEKYSPQKHQ
jgi:hypothetical protein